MSADPAGFARNWLASVEKDLNASGSLQLKLGLIPSQEKLVSEMANARHGVGVLMLLF